MLLYVPQTPLLGFEQTIRWVLLEGDEERDEMVVAMDGDVVVPTLMTARYFGMPTLFDGVQQRITEGIDEENWFVWDKSG